MPKYPGPAILHIRHGMIQHMRRHMRLMFMTVSRHLMRRQMGLMPVVNGRLVHMFGTVPQFRFAPLIFMLMLNVVMLIIVVLCRHSEYPTALQPPSIPKNLQ